MTAGSSSRQRQSFDPPAASYSVTTALSQQSVRSPLWQAHLARGPPRTNPGSPRLRKARIIYRRYQIEGVSQCYDSDL